VNDEVAFGSEGNDPGHEPRDFLSRGPRGAVVVSLLIPEEKAALRRCFFMKNSRNRQEL
jgi:hypothetical protein